MSDIQPPHPRQATIGRRDFLRLSAATVLAAAAATPRDSRAAVRTRAHIVIAGAGAGGLTAAGKLSRWLDGATITVVDPREQHWYQPGFTLVAHGLYSTADVIRATGDYMPSNVRWLRDRVAGFEPDANTVVTAGGERLRYDYLVVALGCELDYGAIEGMDVSLVGSHGIGSTYAGPDGAAATFRASEEFVQKGGVALFTKPATPMKCAGAPLKAAFLTASRMANAGTRGKGELIYLADNDKLFAQPETAALVKQQFDEKKIGYDFDHVLDAVDPGRREARFRTPAGPKTMSYDFLHVVPPMRAAAPVRDSALAWKDGPFAAGGWLEVDKRSLQHRRYPNVFGVGDTNGTPAGKTAATVKKGAPVAMENLVALIEGKSPSAQFDGYTSCPLITDIGHAALVEFNDQYQLTPTIPLVDPLSSNRFVWSVKLYALRPLYLQMLHGRVPA
jgi:sulfide:quinone oxidoreductase